MFFAKCSNFCVDSEKSRKYWQFFFYLSDNCIWIGSHEFSLLWQEYLLWAVNVITGSLNIWDLTKRDLFELNFD